MTDRRGLIRRVSLFVAFGALAVTVLHAEPVEVGHCKPLSGHCCLCHTAAIGSGTRPEALLFFPVCARSFRLVSPLLAAHSDLYAQAPRGPPRSLPV